MKHPVIVVGPDTKVVVREDVKPGMVFLVDADTLWQNNGSGWTRPLLDEDAE